MAAPAPGSPSPTPTPRTPIPTTPLDARTRNEVVETLAAHLDARYVLPEVAAALARELRARLAAGAYAKLGDSVALAERLTTELRALSHDKHLRVMFRPEAPSGLPPPHLSPMLERSSSGIRKLEILDGDIGYLALDAVPRLEQARAGIEAAFALLQPTEALIIDNRNNHGGDPRTVALYMSYLSEGPPVVVNTFHAREGGHVEEFRTVDLGEKSYGVDRPVVVLTSAGTFSGGEELSYDLQAFKRAVLVGERTGGGGNPARLAPLGHGFVAAIPFAQAVHPITGKSWEGVGVTPDVAVPADRALDEALQRLRAQLGPPRPRPGMVITRAGAAPANTDGNLISNGDFGRRLEHWSVDAWKAGGRSVPHEHRFEGGALCVTVKPGGVVSIGWPEVDSGQSAGLLARKPYRLSFRASASGRLPVHVSAHAGQSLKPWLRVASAEVAIEPSARWFSVDVVPEVNVPNGGVIFWITSPGAEGTADVCLDDVALTRVRGARDRSAPPATLAPPESPCKGVRPCPGEIR